MKGLDAWHEFRKQHSDNKKKFVREVMQNPKKFNQPKFDVSILKRWLKNEANISASAQRKNGDRRKTSVEREKVGRYPQMELKLAVHVRNYRLLGLPVDSYLLKHEAKIIFHELFPDKCPMPNIDTYHTDNDPKGMYPLEFSSCWRKAFMDRNNFSHQKLGKKNE